MASINVEVGVEDAKFIAFFQKYKEYTAAAEKQPEAWRKVAQYSSNVKKNAEDTEKANSKAADDLDRASTSMTTLKRLSDQTSRAWLAMQRSTSKVAGNITQATTSLMKWAGITTLVGGLAGAGGLFGMDALARGVSSDRSAAMGSGSGFGSRRSFLLNYGRFGDAEGVLNNINTQKHSANKQALRAMGFTPEEIDSMDSAELAARYEERVQKQTKNVNPSRLSDWMRQRNVDQVMSLEDVQRLQKTDDAEMGGVKSRFKRDTQRFGLDKGQQRGWQEFETTLARASKSIETMFIAALGRLTPGLTKVSDAFTNLLDKIAPNSKDGGPLDRWLDSLNKGLEKFAKYIGTDEAKTSIVKFFRGVKEIAKMVWEFAKGAWNLAKNLGFVTAAQAHEADGTGGGLGAYGRSSRGAGLGIGVRGGKYDSNYRDAASGGRRSNEFYSAIQRAEGTAGKDPYNVWLGNTPSPKPLTEMTLNEALAQGEWLRKNTRIGRRTNSSAKGAFQIVNKTQKWAMRELGLSGNEKMTPEIQRAMADFIYDRQGYGAWEGLKTHPRDRRIVQDNSSYKPNTKTTVQVFPSIGSNPFIGAAGAYTGGH